MTDLFGIEKMLALSWKQPFAGLMLHGKVETRTWSTSYRGLVLICVSAIPYSAHQAWAICGEQMTRVVERLPEYHNFGLAIAVGKLVGCRPMTKQDEDLCFVQYREPWEEVTILKNGKSKTVTKRLYCHFYENVKAIKPFEWKGTQGWKTVEAEIVKSIEYL